MKEKIKLLEAEIELLKQKIKLLEWEMSSNRNINPKPYTPQVTPDWNYSPTILC